MVCEKDSTPMIGPTLETARLVLRPPIHADFDGFAEMAQEEETMRFIGGVAARDAAWRTMAMVAGSWSLLGYSMFSVIEKSSGQWIGRLGPWRPGGKEGSWPGDEIGWALRASAQGKGYAAEGASAAMDWAFDVLGWDNVIHSIDPANTASIALAERLGSYRQRSGVPLAAPYEGVLVDIYGQTKAEWRSRKR
jgi:RimJ/RimL family protein N-acetyltransferase